MDDSATRFSNTSSHEGEDDNSDTSTESTTETSSSLTAAIHKVDTTQQLPSNPDYVDDLPSSPLSPGDQEPAASTFAVVRSRASACRYSYNDSNSKKAPRPISEDNDHSSPTADYSSTAPQNRKGRPRSQPDPNSSSTPHRRKSSARNHDDRENGDEREGAAKEESDGQEVVMRLKTDEFQYDRRTRYKSMFSDAPLYQVYTNNAVRRESFKAISNARQTNSAGTLQLLKSASSIIRATGGIVETDEMDIPAIDEEAVMEDTVTPEEDDTAKNRSSNLIQKFVGTGPNRTRWTEMPEVIQLDLVSSLSNKERKLQEALFEVITSEASYYRSLTVLIDQYYKAPDFDCNSSASSAVLTALQKHHLFSNVIDIHLTSGNFLHDLETRWLENPLLNDICSIVLDHSETKFNTYVTYLKNQPFQIQTLSKLLYTPRFLEAITRIQRGPECNHLDLNSFLLLPMQRVTRLSLLVRTILGYMTPEEGQGSYHTALIALASLEKVLKDCEQQKLHMQQKERMVHICANLDFKKHVKTVSIGDQTLVKEGVIRVGEIAKSASTAFKPGGLFSPKQTEAVLFLCTNVLLVARKRTANGRYSVEDTCPRNQLSVCANDPLPPGAVPTSCKEEDGSSSPLANSPTGDTPTSHRQKNGGGGGAMRRQATGQSTSSCSSSSGLHQTSPASQAESRFPFRLTLNKGARGVAHYGLEPKTLSERERWMDALVPNVRCGDIRNYEHYDWLQVVVNKPYSSCEADELDLKEGDMLKVLIRLQDGWYKGNLPDGSTGWIPSKNTMEVTSEEVRRENMEKFFLSEKARKAYKDYEANQSNAT